MFLHFCLQLKFLKVVTKNLSDPAKSADPKYRQLKLDNEKVRSKLLTCPSAVPLLQALGFVETVEDGDQVLRVEEKSVDHAAMNNIMTEIVSTLSQLNQEGGNAQNENKKPKLISASSSISNASSVNSSSSTSVKPISLPGKLSEKQKARMLLEEKEKQEREAARAHRKKNVALLKADKHVRQNDENWTSAPSAACDKTGNSILTFRDKYGE